MTGSTALLWALSALLAMGAEAGFPNVQPTTGEPWPQPLLVEWDPAYFRVDVNVVNFNVTGETCPDLEEAVERYSKIIADFIIQFRATTAAVRGSDPERTGDGPRVLDTIEVELRSACSADQYPELGMDESYEITSNVGDALGRAVVVADSIWGMYRGLETMSQMFYLDPEVFAIFVRSGHVRDFPRYGHRGLLLDTGRHFLSVDVIKQTLDLMAFHKYNVFHWHVVDDQSFPFYSVRIFFFVFGAYRGDKVYNPDQVADIIEYARKRGIRVIPEFDTPGHTRSWGAIPGLLTECYANGTRDGTFGPIDPTDEQVYLLLRVLFDEVTKRFPDRYIHLGGDEVKFGFDCWLSNPRVQQWMANNSISTAPEIEALYMNKLLDLVSALPQKRLQVLWQDVLDQNVTVRDGTVLQVWKEPWEPEMAKATASGLQTLLSSCWYLNRISYGVDWHPYYECEPESFSGTEEQRALVIGGEACMWGEYVDDRSVIPRTWPRAAAPAERLWSNKTVSSAKEAEGRLEEQRCRLVYRGYNAEPSNGPGFC